MHVAQASASQKAINCHGKKYEVRQSEMKLLWLIDTIWRDRSWSTLIQVLTCCLRTPSYYLNNVNWSSAMSCDIPISQTMPHISILDMSLPLTNQRSEPHLPGVSELAHENLVCLYVPLKQLWFPYWRIYIYIYTYIYIYGGYWPVPPYDGPLGNLG